MKPVFRLPALLGAILACALMSGCGLETPYPDKEYFAIDPGPSTGRPAMTKAAEANNGMVLQVQRLRVASPFDGSTFVYKTGPAQYRSDYYNGFITPTPIMLTGKLIEWLSSTGLYSSVVDTSNSADHHYVLEGNVTELCGDYTEAVPKAVIAAKFFLLDDSSGETDIVFEKAYRQAAALTANTPAALAAAWGQAYRVILEELAADLSHTKQPAPQGASATAGRKGRVGGLGID
jgi:uncharacterized lipoprotein YmbA